ncbi:MAG: F0F1 ATP synthase subunit delta [Alphaproteobacteria bacterium]|nr:F0F1 ATP synthase subunit delta [Alphaproteobacteria bacterium]
MASHRADTNIVAARYAGTLVDLALEAGCLDKVAQDLSDLEGMMADSDALRHLVRTPLAGRADQRAALLALAEKAGFQTITTHFLGVLADNRRLAILDGVLHAFQAETTRRRGGVAARVATAFPLTATQEKNLGKALAKKTGGDVTLSVSIDEALLGGMVVTVGSLMIDDSVRGKLDRLGREMARQGAV